LCSSLQILPELSWWLVHRIDGDGVTLSVLDEGAGPPVLLLHGFPDSSYVWRHQVPALLDAGMRVVAPDLRGFGESDRPEPVDEYAVGRSLADMVALLDRLGIEQVDVVGHDWGAGVAWTLAAYVPERVRRLAVLSVGHPNVLREPSIEQREKAWYQLLFLFEGVAEELLMRDDWRLFREFSRGNVDIDRWLVDLSRPGALTAGLNWYRANSKPGDELRRDTPFPRITVPTLGLWGSGDDYLLEEGMKGSGEHVDAPWRYVRIERASHWLQLDQPARINELLLDFLDPAELSS
jgi:pimeloyl-ACP methyl ester carboxylesterase